MDADDGIVAATVRMLSWRGWNWTPRDDEWAAEPAFAALRRDAGVGLLYAPDRRALLLITETARIGTGALKGLSEAMETHGLVHVELVSRHAVTNHTQNLLPLRDRISVVPWSIVLTGPAGVRAPAGPPPRCIRWTTPRTAPRRPDRTPARSGRSELVPLHRRATPEDLALLPPGVRRGRGAAALPVLRADDPVAQYLALRVGDVVYILRHDGAAYFRAVGPAA